MKFVTISCPDFDILSFVLNSYEYTFVFFPFKYWACGRFWIRESGYLHTPWFGLDIYKLEN